MVNRLGSIGAGDIRVVDNLHRGYWRDSLPSTVEFWRVDIRDPEATADALKGSEIVFHLARTRTSWGRSPTPVTPLVPMY